MQLAVFGTVLIEGDEGPVQLPGAKERAVLAVLTAHLGRPVLTDVIVDAIWPDSDPRDAVRSLRVRVSNIRRALAGIGGAIELVGDAYRLDIPGDRVDIERFRSLADAAREAPAVLAIEICDSALDLWTGDPFGEFRFLEPVLEQAADLESIRRRLRLVRIDALLQLDEFREAAAQAQTMSASEPDAEDVARLCMRALAGSGRVGEALTAYRRLEARLAERGLEPSEETRALEEAILLGDVGATTASERTVPGNLPVAPHPIGRDREVAKVTERLAAARVITVLGPAGSGKTRVAIEAAHQSRGFYPDGVWWVDLSSLSPGGSTALALSRAIGIRAPAGGEVLEVIVTRLRRARMLLVFDNAEHVSESTAIVVSKLAASTTGIDVLVTSQAPLEIAAEERIRLDPLPVPETDGDPDGLRQEAAVALFIDAAERVGRPLLDEELDDVAHIVTGLDGLPLAIELAAVRIAVLSPADIAARLDQRMSILKSSFPDRPVQQRSLEAALSWSVGLLDENDRRLLADLSVFAGRFDLAALEGVCGERHPDLVGSMGRLVDRSLVVSEAGAGGRLFRLLDSIRIHADLMLEAGQRSDVWIRHMDHHLRFVTGRMDPPITVDDLDAVDERLPDIRRAFEHALDVRPLVAARIVAGMGVFWYRRSWWSEGLDWFRRVLAAGIAVDDDLRYRLLSGASPLFLFHAGDSVTAGAMANEMLDLAERLGIERPYNNASLVHSYRGEIDRAMELLRRAIEERRRHGTSPDVPMANLANLLVETGEIEEGRGWALAAIDEARKHGTELFSHARLALVEADVMAGELDRAVQGGVDLLQDWERNGVNSEHQVEVLHLLVQAELGRGAFEAACEALRRANERVTVTGRRTAEHLLVAGVVAARAGRPDVTVMLGSAAKSMLGADEALPPSKDRTLAWAISMPVDDLEALRAEGRGMQPGAALDLAASVTGLRPQAVHEP